MAHFATRSSAWAKPPGRANARPGGVPTVAVSAKMEGTPAARAFTRSPSFAHPTHSPRTARSARNPPLLPGHRYRAAIAAVGYASAVILTAAANLPYAGFFSETPGAAGISARRIPKSLERSPIAGSSCIDKEKAARTGCKRPKSREETPEGAGPYLCDLRVPEYPGKYRKWLPRNSANCERLCNLP
jgi:hypothetical protein